MEQQSDCLKACYQLTDAIYPGLDLSREIIAVQTQNLGDTVFLEDETGLAGFAICHCGAGSEAGSDTCYVKFAAVRPGIYAGEQFEQLLTLCEAYGATQNSLRLVAGVNTSHDAAYTRMVARQLRKSCLPQVGSRSAYTLAFDGVVTPSSSQLLQEVDER